MSDNPPDRRNELAEERTETAEDRTALAAERTYSAWLRTGLGAVAVGVAVERLLPFEPVWTVRVLATLSLTSAVLCFVAGTARYLVLVRRLTASGTAHVPPWVAVGLAALGVAMAAGALALVWAQGFQHGGGRGAI